MPQVTDEKFHKTIFSSPNGKRKDGTIFDRLYCSTQYSEFPLDQIIQTIAEFHGPWTGGSTQLADFSTFVASSLNSISLQNNARQAASNAITAKSASQKIPTAQNGITCAVMPTPLLREFLNRSQKIHPSVNMYIQNNIGTFPYFQQVSEEIGQYANVVMNNTSIDPMKWPNRNGGSCWNTNSRFNVNDLLKIPGDVLTLMDDANNLVNTMFLRSMPKQNNMSFMHTGYSTERPISHGHNFTMDVFNAKREQNAVAPCLAAILNLAGDVLRILNRYFCIKELSKVAIDGFRITFNEGPNGEPITYITDNNARPMYDTEKPNNITDPTNDLVLKTKKKLSTEKS
jgi:hypothetical protein